MRTALLRLAHIVTITTLAVRYQFSAKDQSFWDWCFSDLQRTKERTGRCSKYQLYFLAADAVERRAFASAEKLMYHFHEEIEAYCSPAFKQRLSDFLLGKRADVSGEQASGRS
jgi:hypothetical protein